jgi:hypothetical protein
MDKPLEPEVAEDYSRRIAYAHADDGADKSGWDLTQLLRVPLTYNMKYDEGTVVSVADANQKRYRPKDLDDDYPQVDEYQHLEIPFPEEFPEMDAKEILEVYKTDLNPRVWSLFYDVPQSDWSKQLWQLELLLFESGLSREETYLVVEASACNKYRRDNKPRQLLWREVCKADAFVKDLDSKRFFHADRVDYPSLLTDVERGIVESNPTVVEEYVEWAKTLGDAAWQYHEAGAFVILSSLLASSVKLPTSYGVVTPNLWFMILADTTLTRKTTAMDIAMDLVLEIDSDCVLATDGSIEGLMTSISTRPGRASIFLRDEFSGLIEMMTKRDYYAGMAETLTKLYDGKFQKRVLRREIIEIREPILILFAGGIRTRIYELLNYGHVSSGFLPRFVFIGADSDITKLKPLGPPTEKNLGKRDKLLASFRELYDHYNQQQLIKIGDKEVATQRRWDAELTADAWVLYNRYEADMVAVSLESDRPDLMTPTMDRMAKTGLKMSVLVAAAESPGQEVIVTEDHIKRAFYYVERWVVHTIDLMYNIGKTTSERTLDKILRTIKKHNGIQRSKVMQMHHLTARDADMIFATLEQRGQIERHKRGKGEHYTYVEPVKERV